MQDCVLTNLGDKTVTSIKQMKRNQAKQERETAAKVIRAAYLAKKASVIAAGGLAALVAIEAVEELVDTVDDFFEANDEEDDSFIENTAAAFVDFLDDVVNDDDDIYAESDQGDPDF